MKSRSGYRPRGLITNSLSRVPALYEEWLANETDPAIRAKRAEGFVTHAEHILDVLTHVRRNHGSVESYVLAGGVSGDQLDRVRRRLISSGG